ncbi:hypothetical protein PPERSA_05844 [Pseudocohnilembus persalinus]|uniref:Uncharacterized protein n=1 Tax=Pseudocohnilembus persalinus TaxID=266149 RepID=A0A0V0R3X3_PSEPJ|nr:hypothetical protein PPERSA_05844 [Pseudocohnilembus persalinus]|eukprot:KRX09175.1 hypothetical protein PPERSA_05844 [Pseudocohnilembus persalinus]
MDAQTIQDNVNKYRFGVLIGNSAEERFGVDMANRQRNERIPNSTMKDSFGLHNSAFNQDYSSVSPEEEEFIKHVKYNSLGMQNHLMTGHGLKQEDFEKRHFGTTYDLSFNQGVKTQEQINSKYDADKSKLPRQFNKDEKFEKTYQKSIPEVGGDDEWKIQKHFRSYDEYTKTFDATHFKIPLRK